MNDDGHEGTLESLKYDDDDVIFNFLNNLYSDNLLKDTSIIFLSDHGVVMPSIYYFIDFYKIEQSLPMLFILVNDRKNVTYQQQYKNIHENQQTFITGFDIYNTIANLIYGDKYESIKNKTNYYFDRPKAQKGISLFMKINQKIRSPSNYTLMEKNVCI